MNKNDPKSLQNRLSSSEDEYEYYQIYDEVPRKKYIDSANNLNNIHEEEGNVDSEDSQDSNRANQEIYDYPDYADDEDDDEGMPIYFHFLNEFNNLIL